MKVTIEFDLDSSEDRVMYNHWVNTKSINKNLNILYNKFIDLHENLIRKSEEANLIMEQIAEYFENEIWRKLE